jgi:hypothetical protein
MLSVLSPKKFGIRRIPRLGTEGLKNEIGHVMKKIYTFKGQKGKKTPPEPKNGIWRPKSVWSCDMSIDQEFYMEHEKIYFWGSKRQK